MNGSKKQGMRMTDRDALLHAIRENPSDDTVRLVLADWLEENSEPERAELIRVQCELAPMGAEIDRPRVQELLAREEFLLRNTSAGWLGLRADGWKEGYGPYFRRGVPEVLCLSMDSLLDQGEAYFAAYPTLRELAVFALRGRAKELSEWPGLHRLDVLEIADWVTEADAQHLRRLPRSDGLTLRVWTGGDEDHFTLCYAPPENWPAGARVEVLDLISGESIGAPGAFDEDLDRLAAEFAASGRTLIPLRPQANRFPLRPDQGQNLHPGRLPDGRQVLVGHWREPTKPLVFAFFDEDGYLLGSEQHDDPGHCAYQEDYPPWLEKEFGFRSEMVFLREFSTRQGLKLQLWPKWMADEDFFGARPARISEEEWRKRGGKVWYWLRNGDYVIYWCNDPYVNRWTGEITAT
jgi:uncharacterized protein (TIGR02996 family)